MKPLYKSELHHICKKKLFILLFLTENKSIKMITWKIKLKIVCFTARICYSSSYVQWTFNYPIVISEIFSRTLRQNLFMNKDACKRKSTNQCDFMFYMYIYIYIYMIYKFTEYVQVHLRGNSLIEKYGADNSSTGQGTPHPDFLRMQRLRMNFMWGFFCPYTCFASLCSHSDETRLYPWTM
jgi:hypothetical protein